jgi:hypothetical protein
VKKIIDFNVSSPKAEIALKKRKHGIELWSKFNGYL